MTSDNSFEGKKDISCGNGVIINDVAFRIGEMIHHGSDSRIFSAELIESGGDSAFVIKRYCCPRDSEIWKKAMREIEAGIMLRRCPNIVPMLGYSVLSGTDSADHEIFILFDRVECLDEMRIHDTRPIMEMCRDICNALEYMRKRRLIHCDIKPSNIYYDGVKWLLGDFGSVCVSGEAPEYCSEGYCSPEAIRGERCDVRSDIYSLGISMYRLLSGGRLPFCAVPCSETDEASVYQAIGRRLSGVEITPIPDISEDVNSLLLKMCRFDSRERFRKPSEVSKRAENIIRSDSSSDNV